jgi:hypothetical protein
VSVVAGAVVFFVAGWPGPGTSPVGFLLRGIVVGLAALIPAIYAVRSSLRKRFSGRE